MRESNAWRAVHQASVPDRSVRTQGKPMTLIGFFCAAVCALPVGQISITGADRGASLVERNGAVIGRYIDDTYPGDPRLLAAIESSAFSDEPTSLAIWTTSSASNSRLSAISTEESVAGSHPGADGPG